MFKGRIQSNCLKNFKCVAEIRNSLSPTELGKVTESYEVDEDFALHSFLKRTAYKKLSSQLAKKLRYSGTGKI